MLNYKNLMLVGAAAAVIVLTGCSSTEHHDRTVGRVIDDKVLGTKVSKALHQDPLYKFDGIDVKTYNGVVQLSGFVDTEEQKRRAAEIASRIEGVQQVIDNIALKTGVTPTGRANSATYNNNPNNPNNNNNQNQAPITTTPK
jgi:osmotically-inducible protein OsmY